MRSPRRLPSPRPRRRGVTLLEMLVTVALLLLMMITIVAIFQSATGSVTESRARALLDQDLRRLDATIRQDLDGVTCKMTPPNNPRDNRGYFEYAENALSDAQEEDSDDTLRFTSRAPEGRPFTGRVWVPKAVPPTDPGYNVTPTFPPGNPPGGKSITFEPVPVTSQFAEIIYFQRGDKLYRRVRLILPSFAPQGIGNIPSDPNVAGGTTRSGPGRIGFATNLFEPFALFQNPAFITPPGGNNIAKTVAIGGTQVPFVSWQALNDISARPSKYPPGSPAPATLPAASYLPIPNSLGDLTDRHHRFASPRFSDDYRNNATGTLIPDGLPDDFDGNGVADWYPTMYFNSKAAGLLNDPFNAAGTFGAYTGVRLLDNTQVDRAPFPFLFPNAYTGGIQAAYGLIHAPDPNATLAQRTFNHNPVPTGDSLVVPTSTAGLRTWWGFPTWRETAAPTWLDPIKRINDPATASFFGDPIAAPGGLNEVAYQQVRGLSAQSKINGTSYWLPTQPGAFSDGTPGTLSAFDLGGASVFEDDVVASNVRSFNVKAFDPSPRYYSTASSTFVSLLPGFYDLGYAAGLNPATGTYQTSYAAGVNTVPGTDANVIVPGTGAAVPLSTITGTHPFYLESFGHEGRIPPLTSDLRVDPQYPTFVNGAGSTVPTALGDDTATVVRMRRTWDSWSTTYTDAPALPLDPTTGPISGFAPVVPSYPAPYPAALRGLEIQIRLTDPDDKRIKSITIRQDFTEKL